MKEARSAVPGIARRAACAGVVALAGVVAAGCAPIEPSPRGFTPYRPVVIVSAITPAVAVMQGEGGPVEVMVTNAGFIPVRVIEVLPESAIDDGGAFETESGAVSPQLEPGEVAKATAIVRPAEAGDAVVRRFNVTYTGVVAGKESKRQRPVEVRLKVDPAGASIDEARSRAKVGSQADGVYSASLAAWGFERPDGIVTVPAEGEAQAMPGVSLRAFAWADLFVGDVPVKFASETAKQKVSSTIQVTNRVDAPGESAIPDGSLEALFKAAGTGGFAVDVQAEGQKRFLVVK